MKLTAVTPSTGARLACVVTTRKAPDACEIYASVEGGDAVSASGDAFEDALQDLRGRLES